MAESSFFLESGVFYPFDSASGNIGGGGTLGQLAIWTGNNLIGSAGAPSPALLDTIAGFTTETGVLQRAGAGAYSFLGLNSANGLLQLTAATKLPALDGSLLTGVVPAPLTGEVTTSSLVATINKAILPTWTGLHTFGGGISIRPGALLQGINGAHSSGSSATVAGSSGFPFFYQASPTYTFNQLTAIDQVNVTTGISHGMSATLGVAMETGGANSQGTKVALECQIVCDITGANPTYGRDRAAASFDAFDSVGDGGTATDTVGHTKGTLFAAGFQTVAAAGALNLTSIAAVEFNVAIKTGASAWSRLGASAVSTGNLNAVSNMDCGFEVSSFSGAPAWKTGLMFSSFHGGPPVTASGTLIGTDGIACNAAIGIDFTGVTFSSWIFKHPNFSVDNLGDMTAVNLTLGGAGTFLSWTSSTALEAPSDGVLTISNHALSDFGRLQFGGATSSFPAIKRSTTGLRLRLADDSADTALTLSTLSSGSNQVVGARVTGYAAMTGTPDKASAFATSTVTLAQLAGRMMQLQADLTTHGLIGA